MKPDTIKIDAEFQTLLAPLEPDELRGLEEAIVEHGCLSPLITWRGEGILLDGHNRYKICKRHKIDFEIQTVALADRNAAMKWIINHQLSRRNVPRNIASYLRGKEQKIEKQERGGSREKTSTKAQQNDEFSKVQNEPLKTECTAERLAEKHGVSPATIKRDEKFAAAVDSLPDDARSAALAGELTKAETIKIGAIKNKRERTKAAKDALAGKPVPALADDAPADKAGNPIEDKRVRAVFADAEEWLDEINRAVKRARQLLSQYADHSSAHHLTEDIPTYERQLTEISRRLTWVRPWCVAPADPRMKGRASDAVKKLGWMTKDQYDAMAKGK